MKMRPFAHAFALALAMLLLLSLMAGPAAAASHNPAEPIPVFALAQQDLDGDGRPDLTVIDCAFATERDRVLVYDRGGDMRPGDRWQEMTDFRDDVWIFDAGADGTAQLIILFAQEEGNRAAYLYVDEDGDGEVAYEMQGKEVRITESPHWRLKVTAPGEWLLPDGRPNPHVTFYVDGVTQNLLASYVGLTEGWLDWSVDGQVDWEIETVDQDGDGEADYVLLRLLTEVSNRFSPLRSQVVADLDPRPAQPNVTPIFWPLLFGAGDANAFAKTPAVVMDWATGEVRDASGLGFLSEQSYDILSSAPTWRKGQVNDVLWENPKAYYDLMEDRDGYSEMYIRLTQPWRLDANPDWPLTPDQLTVQYFWDQDDDGRYEYRMTVAGKRPITHTVELADLAVRSVPYEILPGWINGQSWDAAFLLVGEEGGESGGEGLMWTWEGWNALATDYLSGHAAAAPPAAFREIETGYRGEHALHYARQPRLYFSPLDRRLHLRGAQEGVWNMGAGQELRYANLAGGAYLDQWQEARDGAVVQQLNYRDGIYLYSGPDAVQLKPSQQGPALFETQAPQDRAGWERLDALLQAHGAALAPDDFTGLLAQLPGVGLTIQGATARDYRITPQGFRFLLELQPGFSVDAGQGALLPLPTAPGSYVVEYANGAWSLQPATPGAPRVSAVQFGAAAPEALHWTTLELLLHNDGLEDVHDLPLCVTLEDEVGRSVIMTDTVALLPGAGEQRIVWEWAPSAAGPWQVQVAAYCAGAAQATPGGNMLATAVVQVAESGQPSAPWLVSLGGRISGAIVLFLLAAVALAGILATVWAQRADT